MTVKLRAASASDFGAIAALLTASKLPLAGVRDSVDFIVAEDNDEIVGSIGVERYGDYGLLRSAAVSELLRGQGVGRNLVDRALEKASDDGVKEVFLLTETAEEYFRRFGFTRITRADLPRELYASEELRGACPVSAAVMCKKLQRRDYGSLTDEHRWGTDEHR